jgi:hypothetical protein
MNGFCCLNCGEDFPADEAIHYEGSEMADRMNDRGSSAITFEFVRCPHCDSSDLEEIYFCDRCLECRAIAGADQCQLCCDAIDREEAAEYERRLCIDAANPTRDFTLAELVRS